MTHTRAKPYSTCIWTGQNTILYKRTYTISFHLTAIFDNYQLSCLIKNNVCAQNTDCRNCNKFELYDECSKLAI